MKAPTYLALLHYPMRNRKGEVVTTAVTNLDIHDISRSVTTYGLKGYFIVTPVEDQHEIIERILDHWRSERARQHHPDRFEAISKVRLVKTFDDVKEAIAKECGQPPEVVLTDAASHKTSISYSQYREDLAQESRGSQPSVIVFGTGWGVSEIFFPEVDRILAPIYGPEGPEGYNHLSVRSAAAIILDRLFGT